MTEPTATETTWDAIRVDRHNRWMDVRCSGCGTVTRIGWTQTIAAKACTGCGQMIPTGDVWDEETARQDRDDRLREYWAAAAEGVGR